MKKTISSRLCISAATFFLCSFFTQTGGAQSAETETTETLPQLTDDRAPLAGEGFRTEIFGRKVTVPGRNRRDLTAIDLGLAASMPGPTGNKVLPYGALFLYRADDDDRRRLRGIIAALYNDIEYADGRDLPGDFEWVLGLENYWIPFDRSEYISGELQRDEEIEEGRIHLKLGGAWRLPVSPGHTDNAMRVRLTWEPGYLFFEKGFSAPPSFTKPENTTDHRVVLRVSYDGLTRNLFEYKHKGIAFGTELIGGFRGQDWRDWGGADPHSGSSTREYVIWTGYFHAAGPVPFVRDRRRNRWTGGIHFALSEDADRFSAPRLGGGPSGDETGALSYPLLPGAMINEFFSGRFVTAHMEYRREVLFFLFTHFRLTGAYLRRRYNMDTGIDMRNDLLGAATIGLSSGFLFESMIRLNYSFNTGVIRNGEHGGHELLLGWSKEF